MSSALLRLLFLLFFLSFLFFFLFFFLLLAFLFPFVFFASAATQPSSFSSLLLLFFLLSLLQNTLFHLLYFLHSHPVKPVELALGEFLPDTLRTAPLFKAKGPDTAIQEAHVAMQLAAFQLSAGRADVALALADRHIPVVTRSEHAALLSLLLLVKAEALAIMARSDEASQVQRDALAWARYGFGDEREIRARAAEIRAISPRPRTAGAS